MHFCIKSFHPSEVKTTYHYEHIPFNVHRVHMCIFVSIPRIMVEGLFVAAGQQNGLTIVRTKISQSNL